MKITTVIITLNEAAKIADCVKQGLKLSDEVIVIDAQSTDSTVAIAREHGANVIVRKWESYGKTKNFGNDLARNDWILSLDGDEVLSDDFITNFKNVRLNNNTIYEIDIRTYYQGKLLRSSGFYPLWKKRIFNRKMVSWDEAEVHEALRFDRSMKIKRISGPVFHYSIKSKEQYQSKLDHYARLGAIEWIKKGKAPGFLKRKFGPGFRFFKSYVLQKGIIDGKTGIDLAIMQMKANRAKLNYFKELSQKQLVPNG